MFTQSSLDLIDSEDDFKLSDEASSSSSESSDDEVHPLSAVLIKVEK